MEYAITDAGSAKEQLFRRLRQAVLGTRSAGELAVFQGYYERYGVSLGDRLPALIPQVYLHYDPTLAASVATNSSLRVSEWTFC
ncbi:hypothetical protein CA830_03975 [Burkholderia multivorans]|nr:hypothetical protein CA830_03975 [Burkholderia multivorans]